jgi:hypothetical protein
MGFGWKTWAPRLRASASKSGNPDHATMIGRGGGSLLRMSEISSSPFMSGIMTSVTTTSGRQARTMSRAAWPENAVRTSYGVVLSSTAT